MHRYIASSNRVPKRANLPSNGNKEAYHVNNRLAIHSPHALQGVQKQCIDKLSLLISLAQKSDFNKKLCSVRPSNNGFHLQRGKGVPPKAKKPTVDDKFFNLLLSIDSHATVANNFAAGMADQLTEGTTSWVVEKSYGKEFVGDKTSDAYLLGEMFGLTVGAYISSAKTGAKGILKGAAVGIGLISDFASVTNVLQTLSSGDVYKITTLFVKHFYKYVGGKAAGPNGLRLSENGAELLEEWSAFVSEKIMSLGESTSKK